MKSCDGFAQLVHNTRILDLVEQVVGPDLILRLTHMLRKQCLGACAHYWGQVRLLHHIKFQYQQGLRMYATNTLPGILPKALLLAVVVLLCGCQTLGAGALPDPSLLRAVSSPDASATDDGGGTDGAPSPGGS